MKYRVCQIMMGISLLLTASSCLAKISDMEDATSLPTPMTGGSIDIRTNQFQYSSLEGLMLIVFNGTLTDIRIPTPRDAEVGEQTFRFYQKTMVGWERLCPIPGYLAVPIAEDSRLSIPAGHEIEFSISHTMGSYCAYRSKSPRLTGEFVVQIKYEQDHRATDNELVQYSNEFLIGETETVEVNAVVVSAQSQSLTFNLQNDSDAPLWFPSPCSSIPGHYVHTAFGDDGYLSLQRATSEGTWQIIHIDETDCDDKTEPIRVDPGEAVTIAAAQWFQSELDNIIPGIYRWDVVFYLENYESSTLRDVRHVFSEPFEYEQ